MIKRKVSKILAIATIFCSAISITSNATQANATQLNTERSSVSIGKVTAKSGLNIRKSATTSSQILRTIPYNGQVNIKSKSGSWYYIEYNGTYGYVSDSYINQISSGNSGSNSNAQTQTSGTGRVTARSGLNLRKSASTSSGIIRTIPYNGQVNIKSKSGSWYYVEYNGSYGYVSDDYIQKTSSVSSNSQDSSSNSNTQTQINGYGKVTARSGLNLRKGASTGSGLITTIPYNSQVKLKSKSGNWYYVEYNGSLGYVNADYVQKTSGSSSNSQNTNNASSKYNKVLSAMKSQIGKPYLYGGSSPSTGFDCSGLMQWGFKQAGINIGRTTYDQVKAGSAVNINSAKPGDLLVYSSKEHIGMYIGNGQWIEAPSTGKTVRIASVPWNKIGYARRVIN
ncbi:SH3 domain-containing C40 family peptidase [Clostridium sardiniense]|uniref:C40 family peptidase n=1 Tax=Clostridium sardiniense TaxID=29369 RepID=UPI00195A22A2|nr:SH3 domain-containing C40 family peptidase [Clostridium sardiniense]MBM7833134.1 putative enterotoxin B [Clostridium sardiniense]